MQYETHRHPLSHLEWEIHVYISIPRPETWILQWVFKISTFDNHHTLTFLKNFPVILDTNINHKQGILGSVSVEWLLYRAQHTLWVAVNYYLIPFRLGLLYCPKWPPCQKRPFSIYWLHANWTCMEWPPVWEDHFLYQMRSFNLDRFGHNSKYSKWSKIEGGISNLLNQQAFDGVHDEDSSKQ